MRAENIAHAGPGATLCYAGRSGRDEGAIVRWWALALALFAAGRAEADPSCDQVAKVALATLEYRDQGYPLKAITDGVDQMRSDGKLTDSDLDQLRMVVKLVYLRTRSPGELVEACQEDEKAKKKK